MEQLKLRVLECLSLEEPSGLLSELEEQNEDCLKEMTGCFEESQLKQLWDGLSGHIITATINEAANATITEEQQSTTSANTVSVRVLELAVRLAKCTVSQNGCIVPQSLYESTLLLHGYVLTSCNTNLKEQVAELCELWWCNGIEGKESLVSAPIIYLLEKCLLSKPKVKHIKELWKLRDAVSCIGNDEETISLLLNLFSNSNFIRINQGQKFLSHVMMSKPDVLKRIHSVVKFKLPSVPITVAEIYASITISAWEKCEDDTVKSSIETDIIQDLMYSTIHMQRSGAKSLNILLMKYLSRIHSRKSSPGVNMMLIRLYQPFLWRSLKAANADVRANATQIFFDAFPLVDSSQSKQECETNLQKQFDLIFDLLEDEDHTVRQVSVTGVSQVLVTYWDQIPTDVSSDLLNILFAKLAWDQSSDDVRVAVIKGIQTLLDNHLTHAVLAAQMPTLGDLFHDKIEKVRLEFVKLLLKLKHIRVFKVWKIVSKEHLFARLEVDSASVCVKLVELTYKSFINDDIENHVQLERCIELIESGLEKARRFFRYAVVQINVQQAVKYMLLLRKCVMTCVSRHRQKGKENRKPSLCTTLANMTMSQNKTLQHDMTNAATLSNFTMIDNHLTQVTLKDGDDSQDEEELTIGNTSVMRGLFDIICILWAGFKKELSMSGKDELNKLLCDKFSRALTEFFPIFEDKEIQQCLLYLASFLPQNQTSVLRKNAEHRLRDLPSLNLTDAECGSLVLCLCQWGLANKLMDVCHKWVTPLTRTAANKRKSRDSEDTESQLKSLVQVLNCLLTLPTCLETLKWEHSDRLHELSTKLHNIHNVCLRSLSTGCTLQWNVQLVTALLTVDAKLSLILYQDNTEKLSDYVSELCSLVRNHCIKHLQIHENDADVEKTTLHNETKRPRRLLNLQLEELHGGNDSTLSNLDCSSGDMAELSRLVIVSALTVATNYLLLVSPSDAVLYELNRLYKTTESLALAGDEVISCLSEMTIQLSQCRLILGAGFPLPLTDCYSEVIKARLQHIYNADSMAGRNKTSWVSFLRSVDVLPEDLQSSIASCLTSTMVQILGDTDMTPTLSAYITSSIKSSATIQSIVVQELNDKLNTFSTEDNEQSVDTAQKDIIIQLLSKVQALPQQAETT